MVLLNKINDLHVTWCSVTNVRCHSQPYAALPIVMSSSTFSEESVLC